MADQVLNGPVLEKSQVDQAIDAAVAAVEATVTKATDLRAQLDALQAQRKDLAQQISALQAQIAEAEGPDARKAQAMAKFAELIKSGKPNPALRQFGF